MRWAAALLAVAWVAFARPAQAHEMRPAYFEVVEAPAGTYAALWKTPMVGDARLALSVELSGDGLSATDVVTRATSGAALQTWTFRTDALRGRTVRVRGLEGTMTDVLVRVSFADGTTWTHRLTPRAPAAAVPARQDAWALAGVYAALGVEHILFGVDHLLFVLGLLLIVRGRWALVRTVTAFTVAHSITLAAATLGYARVPLAPLNATIASSILFLGPEIVRAWRGGSSLTSRRPWTVAFAFGLLHGLGFSTALTDAGLPRGDLPLALLTFNVGVELGQVGFVALVVLLERSFRQLELRWPAWAARVPGYAVGTLGAYWTIERTVAMWRGGA